MVESSLSASTAAGVAGHPARPAADARMGGVAKMPWASLMIIASCYALAFTDRQIINLMVEALKRDYGISDTQAGFLLGPAFTVSYVSLGLLAGFCADRFSRRHLLLMAGTLWSFSTLATAFVHSYAGVVTTRIMVGGSEAFLFPAGMSLVADMFDRRRLPIATTIFLISPYAGGGLAMIMGGVIVGRTAGIREIAVPPFGTMHGWQIALAAAGLIGLIPVLAVALVREPVRGKPEVGEDRTLGFADGVAYMARRWRFYAMFFFGLSCTSIMFYTVPAWVPSMFARQYGMTAHDIGLLYGVLVLICGIGGGLLSPLINRFLAPRYADSTMRSVLAGPLLMACAGAALPFAGNRWMALACIALITIGYACALPMAGASLQLATPPRLRGLASASYFVIVTIIALGVGPMVVPFITHVVLGDEKRIGDALGLIAVVCSSLSFLMLVFALRGFRIERGIRLPRAVSGI